MISRKNQKMTKNQYPASNVKIPPSIYFGGCAFGSGFYVGAYQAMSEVWGADFFKEVLFSGGSAGTIFAVGIALGKSPEYMSDLYRNISEKCHRYGTIYKCSVFMEQSLRELLSDPNSYKILEGRCCFGTTAFFAKHRWHVSWTDNEDLIKCIQASYHIPFYCKRVDPIYGIEVLDGAYGFAGKDLPHGDNTLYVGIDPHAEITRIFTNLEMFYPSVGKDYDDMVQSGYDAFMNWNGSIYKKVGSRKPNYEALYVLWMLKFLEILLYKIIDPFYYIFFLIYNKFVNRTD